MNDYKLNLINKALSSAAGLFCSVIVARYLGVALRGELAFLTQTAGLLAIVFGLGLNQAFPYFFKTNPDRSVYETFVRLFLIQFAIYSMGAAFICFVFQDRSMRYLALLLVSTLLYQQMESVVAAYNIQLKIRINIATSFVRVLAHGAMLLWFPANLLWPVVISSGVWLLAVAFYLLGTGIALSRHVDMRQARDIVSYSWLPMLTAVLVVMNYNVDTLMLKWLGTPIDLGQYAVAAGIVVYLWVIPDAIKEVLVSRVVRSHDVKRVVVPLKLAVAFGLASVVLLAALGRVAIRVLYGPDFAPAYGLAVILSFGVVSMIYYKILGVVVLAEGRRVFYFATLAVAVLVNAVANLFAIPAFGAAGAAWASVVSYGVTGAAFLLYFSRVHDVGLRDMLVITPHDLRRGEARWDAVSRD